MPSDSFFPLSPPSRFGLFHPYAVAESALGYSSNSSVRGSPTRALRTAFAIRLPVAPYIPIAKARGFTTRLIMI